MKFRIIMTIISILLSVAVWVYANGLPSSSADHTPVQTQTQPSDQSMQSFKVN